MGYYSDNVLPRILNKAMDTKIERATRERVCKGLRGEVVEIGFGSGLNVGHYPPEVTRVVAVEPSRVSMQLARPRLASATANVELGGLDGQRLDLPSEQFDAVLSTWTLCFSSTDRRVVAHVLALGIHADVSLGRIDAEVTLVHDLAQVVELGRLRPLHHLFVEIDGDVGVVAHVVDAGLVREHCVPALFEVFRGGRV